MKKKGFTLVELLVVIAIIAMLLAILMPALGKVRQLAYRLMCGTNLKGLGTAMMVYSNDYDESYPVSGGKSSASRQWSNALSTSNYTWKAEETVITWSTVSDLTITSSWYLLIKYADVSAAQFVCQASDQKRFEFDTAAVANTKITDLTMLWDFGASDTTDNPYNHVSYCMQNPFFGFSLSASGSASKPIAADRNPWISTSAADEGKFLSPVTAAVGTTTTPQLLTGTGGDTSATEFWSKSTADNRKGATSAAHQQEGQNVLFNDGHVSFEKTVVCGVEQDNIYTTWAAYNSTTDKDKQGGVAPTAGKRSAIKLNTATPYTNATLSKAENDSFLTL